MLLCINSIKFPELYMYVEVKYRPVVGSEISIQTDKGIVFGKVIRVNNGTYFDHVIYVVIS